MGTDQSKRREVDSGGQAFPTPTVADSDGDVLEYGETGMTLRDWFAGKALAGLLADGQTLTAATSIAGTMSGRSPKQAFEQSEIIELIQKDLSSLVAGAAYRLADAMISARSEGGAE